MKTVLDRIKEPSTWAGLSVLGLVFGLPPGTMDLVIQLVTAGAGIAGIVLAEKAK